MKLNNDAEPKQPLANSFGDSGITIKAIPRQHWDRLVLTIVSIVIFVALIYIFATSKNIRWDQVGHYLFLAPIIAGLWVTIKLTIISVIFGSVIGVFAALMGLSDNPIPKILSTLYIWIFRGTPLLVQIIFFFNLALFIPTIGIGKFSVSTNSIMTTFFTAVLSLGLFQGAYMAEIIRGGILSVPFGQKEAALAQGMSRSQTMWRVILPQSMRVIIPTTGNQAIQMLKSTSLVSVIAAKDLLTQAQIIYYGNYLIIELLLVACFWYLVLTTIGTIGQSFLEDIYSAGSEKTKKNSLIRKIYTNLKPRSFKTRGSA